MAKKKTTEEPNTSAASSTEKVAAEDVSSSTTANTKTEESSTKAENDTEKKTATNIKAETKQNPASPASAKKKKNKAKKAEEIIEKAVAENDDEQPPPPPATTESQMAADPVKKVESLDLNKNATENSTSTKKKKKNQNNQNAQNAGNASNKHSKKNKNNRTNPPNSQPPAAPKNLATGTSSGSMSNMSNMGLMAAQMGGLGLNNGLQPVNINGQIMYMPQQNQMNQLVQLANGQFVPANLVMQTGLVMQPQQPILGLNQSQPIQVQCLTDATGRMTMTVGGVIQTMPIVAHPSNGANGMCELQFLEIGENQYVDKLCFHAGGQIIPLSPIDINLILIGMVQIHYQTLKNLNVCDLIQRLIRVPIVKHTRDPQLFISLSTILKFAQKFGGPTLETEKLIEAADNLPECLVLNEKKDALRPKESEAELKENAQKRNAVYIRDSNEGTLEKEWGEEKLKEFLVKVGSKVKGFEEDNIQKITLESKANQYLIQFSSEEIAQSFAFTLRMENAPWEADEDGKPSTKKVQCGIKSALAFKSFTHHGSNSTDALGKSISQPNPLGTAQSAPNAVNAAGQNLPIVSRPMIKKNQVLQNAAGLQVLGNANGVLQAGSLPIFNPVTQQLVMGGTLAPLPAGMANLTGY